MTNIDINSDIGESYGAWTIGADAVLYDLISSANIACGFHGGDPTTISCACATAVDRGIAIGAQVSYPDLRGFGRRFIQIPPTDLIADIIYQIGALTALAKIHGGVVSYVKAHGALYNAIMHYEQHARALVTAITNYDPTLDLLCSPGSVVMKYAREKGVRTIREAFIDRVYLPEGSLMPRSEPGAVITDPARMCEQAMRIINDHEVIAINGQRIPLIADSLCIHSDTPTAADAVELLQQTLADAQIHIRSWTS